MEKGLLWLPLLIFFIGITWAGWNEYRKVDAYQSWAKQFERGKYDILAVLGYRATEITWGTPTRHGPTNLQTFPLTSVTSLCLVVDNQPVNPCDLPQGGRNIALEFQCADRTEPIRIAFTDVYLAGQWENYLQKELQNLRLNSTG